MTDQLKVIVGGAVAVVAFDAVAAFASRQFGFAYANASAGSYLLYGVIGFLAARNAQVSPVLSAVVASAIAGCVDASIGWAVSWALGPGRPPAGTQLTATRWFGIAVFVVALACAIGAVGGVIGRRAASNVAAA